MILLIGFARAHAIASVAIAALMLRSASSLVRATGRSLLEAAPAGPDPDAIGEALTARAHADNVYDVHVCEITSGLPALNAHMLVHPGDDCHAIRLELECFPAERFGIEHTTLQVNHSIDPSVRWCRSAPA